MRLVGDFANFLEQTSDSSIVVESTRKPIIRTFRSVYPKKIALHGKDRSILFKMQKKMPVKVSFFAEKQSLNGFEFQTKTKAILPLFCKKIKKTCIFLHHMQLFATCAEQK